MRRLLFVILLVTASGVLLWNLGDPAVVTATLTRLSPDILVGVLLLLLLNEVVKGLRWAWYLRAAQLPIRVVDGLTSYLAAQAASAIPGGSLLSARLAEEHGSGAVRLRHTTPPLLAQGLGDLVAVSLLALAAIVLLGRAWLQVLAPLTGIVLTLALISAARSDRLGDALIHLLSRSRRTRRLIPVEEDARRTLRRLCTWRALAPGIAASIVSTLIAAGLLVILARALTLRGLQVHEALYAHSMAMIAHLVLPVPNGFGTSDMSLVGFLNLVGIGFGRATVLAITYRALSLGFRTTLGFVVLLARYRHLLLELRRRPQADPAPLVTVGLALNEPER